MGHQYTLNTGETPSEGIYSVVATEENCSPIDLLPLAEVIDPEALDALLTPKNERSCVSFEYCGYEVKATLDEICVERPNDG